MYNSKKQKKQYMTTKPADRHNEVVNSKRFDLVLEILQNFFNLDSRPMHDHKFDRFVNYDTTYFFEIKSKDKNNWCIGIHKRNSGDAYIFIVLKTLEDLKLDIEVPNPSRKIQPNCVLSFKKEVSGIISIFLRPESGLRINISSFHGDSLDSMVKLIKIASDIVKEKNKPILEKIKEEKERKRETGETTEVPVIFL